MKRIEKRDRALTEFFGSLCVFVFVCTCIGFKDTKNLVYVYIWKVKNLWVVWNSCSIFLPSGHIVDKISLSHTL